MNQQPTTQAEQHMLSAPVYAIPDVCGCGPDCSCGEACLCTPDARCTDD